MKQTSFSDAEFASKKRPTRRDRFLAEIEAVTPWPALVAALLPYYPKGEGRGRPPVGLERMLRMYIAQQCFGLSDEGIEDAIYDSQAIRGFVGIDLTHESAPDATALLKFRRLLEKHNLTRRIFDEINGHLASKGLMMREGTIVDATLIAAPPSTKNRDEKLDPEMHQSKKGKNWFFGMKAHIGVDAKSGLTHTLVTTAGNVSDVTQTHNLLHGDEKMVFGDSGYQGADKRPENADKAVIWHIAMKRSVRKAMKKNPLGRAKEKLEKAKASVRAKVEHPFHVLKNLFKYRKTRYRGLAKNTAQLHTLFAFANLVLADRTFGSAHARTPS
ncbi:IS5 family transposase [Massilia sp. TW-1]|uniref:IS5 family transposase n=1 Tax=Telluria antibiotica TaxID=2717319 RepID=A0ABX0PF28_9BURK|nr:IS5 family transposase [Telluria antibiotica]NIA55063.1 IS5 family transposase [Telluria antibiotica]